MSTTSSPTEAVRPPVAAPRAPLFDDYGLGCQNGITDPRWPETFEQFVEVYEQTEHGNLAELETRIGPEHLKRFQNDYPKLAGHRQPQEVVTIVLADVICQGKNLAARRKDLEHLLKLTTLFIWEQMQRTPARSHLRELDHLGVPDSYRVTITLGLGSTLFATEYGDDRFGIRSYKPRSLRPMPSLPGDISGLREKGTDLLLMICSDHPYVNAAIARAFLVATTSNLRATRIEQGFSRPDTREWLRFDDGIANLRGDDLGRLVYVADRDDEPAWCRNGTYLVYCKIAENLRRWDDMPTSQQERMIGRRKSDGQPLAARIDPDAKPPGMIPIYGPPGSSDAPVDAHMRKVQPRRVGPDILGIEDLDRRFLRRAYPFFDGVTAQGNILAGLQFIAFMRDIRKQFEWVSQMWQFNPDFPVPNSGIDAMYASGILTTLLGGYYFCPPAPKAPGEEATIDGLADYYGAKMLRD